MKVTVWIAVSMLLAGCSSPRNTDSEQVPPGDVLATDVLWLRGDGTLAAEANWGTTQKTPFVEGEGVWSITLEAPSRPSSASWNVWVDIPQNAVTMPTEIPCRWSITIIAQVDRANESEVVTVGEACSRDPGIVQAGPQRLQGSLDGQTLSSLPIQDGTKLSLSITTSIRGVDGAEVALLWGSEERDSELSMPSLGHTV